MQASATAGIEFSGTTMRYSEVEQYGAQHRLLRLGDCDFEFDVSEVLFELGTQKYLDVVTDALSEIFLGTTATRIRIAIHPQAARVLQSLRFSGANEESIRENVAFESALMHDEVWVEEDRHVMQGRPLSPTSDSAHAPDMESLLVSEISGPVKKRLHEVTSRIPDASPDIISSTEALLAVVRETASKNDFDGYQLSVGLYPSYAEFMVTRGSEWISSQIRSETESGDVAYFALHFLELSGVVREDDVRVRVYGSGASREQQETLTSIFFENISVLNPISIVDLETDQFDSEFQFESFVICLGAAL
ncbi:MAG: hypothetical protein BMS9Abin05_1718 [Rhodothermia bacterium]|nr:MAG: hypothetical protein BMS9Abin05_1718 [Rhodothermia bacterium]